MRRAVGDEGERMRFLVIPDSFKGSMTARTVCDTVKAAILRRDPDASVTAFPAFDGGEGSAECLAEIYGGRMISFPASNATGRRAPSTFGMKDDTAFIAVADTSGLPGAKIRNPFVTTTRGFGEQIAEAIRRGAKHVVIGLGGSSTNDGGAGAAVALGAVFRDEAGNTFLPTGGTLGKIASVDVTELKKRIAGVRFTALCDVTNPLTGENGCSFVYAKQKGARSRKKRAELDGYMQHYAEVTSFLGVSPDLPGSGAAGGLGYFVRAFLSGESVSGADFFLDAIRFDERINDVDFVVCGEGKFDATSGQGKICGKIISRAAKYGKPVVVFCGATEKAPAPAGTVIRTINDDSLSLEENFARSRENLLRAVNAWLDELPADN